MWKHTLKTAEALFVPMGVAVAEKCPPAQNFIYGMRKSVLCVSAKSPPAYEFILNMFKAENRNIDKMEKIYHALKNKADEKSKAAPGAPKGPAASATAS